MHAVPIGRRKRLLFAVAALFGSTAAAFLAVEIAFHFLPYSAKEKYGYLTPLPPYGSPYFDEIYGESTTPGLAMELAPNRTKWERNGSVYHVNGLGMRDDLPMAENGNRIVRIALLGDSFAFGYGLNLEDGFAAVLERRLNGAAETGVRYDVLNFAAPSYAAQDQPAILREKAMKWDPDLVILTYVLNDPETDPVQWPQRYWAPIAPWRRSALLRAAFLLKNRIEIARFGGGDYTAYLHAPDRPKWQSVRRAFAEIADVCGENGIPVLFVMFAEPSVLRWEDYPFHKLHDQVRGEAEKNGFDWLDTLPLWSKAAPPERIRLSPEDAHPNALGHEIAADAVYRSGYANPSLERSQIRAGRSAFRSIWSRRSTASSAPAAGSFSSSNGRPPSRSWPASWRCPLSGSRIFAESHRRRSHSKALSARKRIARSAISSRIIRRSHPPRPRRI